MLQRRVKLLRGSTTIGPTKGRITEQRAQAGLRTEGAEARLAVFVPVALRFAAGQLGCRGDAGAFRHERRPHMLARGGSRAREVIPRRYWGRCDPFRPPIGGDREQPGRCRSIVFGSTR